MRRRVALVTALSPAILAACAAERGYEPEVPDGNVQRGKAALERYECGVCHVIPGVHGARGLVGPPLNSYRRHVYIAGKFPNSPDILVRWIQDPPALAPRTAMPNVGVSEAQARDMAAFLYTLK